MKKAIRLSIQGAVQGVGFRYYVRSGATALGVTGWVRNLPDGSVQVHAEGEEDRLHAFREHLQAESTYARIRSVEAEDVPVEDCTSFEVRY